ncbi:MAG: hypothetical protein WC869_04875 [Phycisphaerae bacterium]|jgi:hypothetical protein
MSTRLDRLRRDLVKCEDMRLHAQRARRFLGARALEEFQTDELAPLIKVLETEVGWTEEG